MSIPADPVEHLDKLWNDPEEKRVSAMALAILKESDPPKPKKVTT